MSLRAGISLGAGASPESWPRMLRFVDHAEALGLHSIWVPEGHFRRGATASPLLVLAAFAARTRKLRLGTTSLLLPIHPPARVANETAALDALSRGRLILGLGRGFREPVFRGFGVAAAEKRDRFDAALDAILEIWAGDRPGLRPVQRPHPPLVVAAFGRKGLLQAARRSLPYLASPLESLELLEENLAVHREALPGPVRGELKTPVMRTLHVAGDEHEARQVEAALAEESRQLTAGARGAVARAAAGPQSERVLVGTCAQVGEKLQLYRERLGMDLVIARPALGCAPDGACIDSLSRLHEEVLPALSQVDDPWHAVPPQEPEQS